MEIGNCYFNEETGKWGCVFCGHEWIENYRLTFNKSGFLALPRRKCPNCRARLEPSLNGRPSQRSNTAVYPEIEV